jgi:molybdenum cofactor cytidylyltransferase
LDELTLRDDSFPRIAGVILAAGGSARFGSPKQLITHYGENIVRRSARVALEAGLSPVIVVLGAYASTILPFLAGLESVVTVLNDSWEEGQSTSLITGLDEAQRQECDAAVVLLADQPGVDSESIERLVRKYNPHNAVASEYNGVVGAPALVPSEFFNELRMIRGDQGAGKWLRDNPDRVTTIAMSEAAFDIDTPDDLEHLPPE